MTPICNTNSRSLTGLNNPSCTASPSSLLIVEDEPIIQGVYKAFLKNLQYSADFAATYHEAQLKIQQTQYQLIITDISLPDGNGLDLAEQCLKNTSPPTIIIISAHSSDTIQERIQSLRCQYLSKPITFEQFKGLLKHPLSVNLQ